MRRLAFPAFFLALFALGYFAGTNNLLAPQALSAADDEPDAVDLLDDSVIQAIRDAVQAAESAGDALSTEGKYQPATVGVNHFAIAMGGLNAREDLDSGRGVDPETFAALYAGRATDDIAQHIATDDLGRLTYKGKLIRLYSKARLENAFTLREKISGAE